MSFLTDSDLEAKLLAGQLLTLPPGTDPLSRIKGCALELQVGEIFLPGADKDTVGTIGKPRSDYALREGETAVITTRDPLQLDNGHFAIAFPASSVSISGLLMTNPGQVDPGYSGPLHVTVINMGREPYALKTGARLLRAAIYKLEKPLASGISGAGNPVSEELLARLAPDFLSVGSRIDATTKREIESSDRKAKQWAVWVPLVIAIILGVGNYFWATKEHSERLQKLESANAAQRIHDLEISFPTEKRLNTLESSRVREVEEKVHRLEQDLSRRGKR